MMSMFDYSKYIIPLTFYWLIIDGIIIIIVITYNTTFNHGGPIVGGLGGGATQYNCPNANDKYVVIENLWIVCKTLADEYDIWI